MYEDPWYNFVPEAHSKQEDGHTRKSQHRQRESLLKQPNDNEHPATLSTNALINLSKEPSSIKSPPTATVARRAKSYSDFYKVAQAQLAKESKRFKEREQFSFHPTAAVNYGLNFESLYDTYEDELLYSSQEMFQVYRDQLALSERHLDGLLQDTSLALDLLASLSGSFKSVEAQTMAFQAQCQDVLAEQKHLRILSDEVGTGLKYYAYLEPVTRRLNAPGASSVIGDDGFVEVLTNLDGCIKYLIAHPTHREADVYLTRYKSVLVRTINIMANLFASRLRDQMADIKEKAARLRQEQKHSLTATKVYLLLAPESDVNGKLLLNSLKHVIRNAQEAMEMNEKTASSQPGANGKRDYLAIYEEGLERMITEYTNSRFDVVVDFVEDLIRSSVSEDFDPKTDLLRYARNALNSTFEICVNENVRFTNLFQADSSSLYEDWTSPIFTSLNRGVFRNYLSKIASRAFEILKPDVQIAEVTTAIDLVTWSNGFAYYRGIPGRLVSSNGDEDEEEEADLEGWKSAKQAKARVAGEISKMIVNTVFGRIREIILRDIEHYTPRAEDLVVSSSSIQTARIHKSLDNADEPFYEDVWERLVKALGPGLLGAFLPVKTASRLLVYITDLTFEHDGDKEANDIAYEILHQACSAILRATSQIVARSSKVDGRIFAIKNLLLMKNLVVAYDISGSRRAPALDFTDVWNTFGELRARGRLFELSTYYKLLTSGNLLPKVVENIQDARVELDGQLRENITIFREECTSMLLKGESGGKKGAKAPEEIIKEKLANAFPQEEQLRESLWEAVKTFGEDKKKVSI